MLKTVTLEKMIDAIERCIEKRAYSKDDYLRVRLSFITRVYVAYVATIVIVGIVELWLLLQKIFYPVLRTYFEALLSEDSTCKSDNKELAKSSLKSDILTTLYFQDAASSASRFSSILFDILLSHPNSLIILSTPTTNEGLEKI